MSEASNLPSSTSASMMHVSRRTRRVLPWAVAVLQRPETITLVLLLAAFGLGAMLSPYFLNVAGLLDSTSLYMETGVMALAMTLVIISGNIDLSVASILALSAVLSAELYARFNLPMAVAAGLAPLIGAVLGLINGLLVTKVRLPSLVATLGTMSLYRGLAQVMVGDRSIGHFPEWFVGIDFRTVGPVPLPLILFLVLAILVGVVLRNTVLGRCVYAVGTNEAAARFNGMRVDRVKLGVFVFSGFMAGVAAVMMLSRLSVARFDLANGDELAVITVVVLGGTDIFGGRGKILGTVIALFLLGVIRQGMGLADISAQKQQVVTGTLLVAAVLLTRTLDWASLRLDQTLKGHENA